MTETGEEEDVQIIVRDIHVSLSREHLAVMECLARGMTYDEIGRELGMHGDTVYSRVVDVRNRLGVGTRLEALLLLLSSGNLPMNLPTNL